jgi:hypothetical protein
VPPDPAGPLWRATRPRGSALARHPDPRVRSGAPPGPAGPLSRHPAPRVRFLAAPDPAGRLSRHPTPRVRTSSVTSTSAVEFAHFLFVPSVLFILTYQDIGGAKSVQCRTPAICGTRRMNRRRHVGFRERKRTEYSVACVVIASHVATYLKIAAQKPLSCGWLWGDNGVLCETGRINSAPRIT